LYKKRGTNTKHYERPTQQSNNGYRNRSRHNHRNRIYHYLILNTMKTTIKIVLIAAATFFTLNAMAQDYRVGQPWPQDAQESSLELPRLFRVDSPPNTWMRADDLRDKRINRVLTSVAAFVVFPPSGIVLGPLSVVDFFVTKRKLRKNANLISK